MSLPTFADDELSLLEREKQIELELLRLGHEPPPDLHLSGADLLALEDWIEREVTIEDPQREPSIIPFELWPAQRDVLQALQNVAQIIILKARQLGITWLVLAYALYLCIFHDNKTVIVISKDQDAANETVRRVRGMFTRLKTRPHAIVIDNVGEVAWSNGSRIKAFASSSDAGSSFTGSLLILDELAKNPKADEIYTSAKPTIDDGGRVVILSTAKGKDNLFHRLWVKATEGANNLKAIFVSWRARPGRDEAWYARTAAGAVSMAHHMQEYPATPAEAFQALGDTPFLQSIAWWDACQEALPPLTRAEPMVVALDAAVSGDSFGLVAVTRHPARRGDVAVRHVQSWRPPAGGVIDYGAAGGPLEVLNALIDSWNVVQVTYDPYQLHAPMTELRKRGRVYVSDFGQQTERLEADAQLRQLIMQRRLAHPGDAMLTAHIANADAKVDAGESRLRIVKREQSLKIDLAVALSMAAHRCLRLSL